MRDIGGIPLHWLFLENSEKILDDSMKKTTQNTLGDLQTSPKQLESSKKSFRMLRYSNSKIEHQEKNSPFLSKKEHFFSKLWNEVDAEPCILLT